MRCLGCKKTSKTPRGKTRETQRCVKCRTGKDIGNKSRYHPKNKT